MRRSLGLAFGLTIVLTVAGSPVMADNGSSVEAGLSGSHASMERQNEVAREHDFSFVRNGRQVNALVEQGALIPVSSTKDYKLANVSHPVTRPTTKTFVERLGRDYHSACGSPLVVTSLTRPLNEQPENASDLSVHPAGMAVDLRVPGASSCRRWLEGTLLSLERKGVLDVTREHHPSHYHVAVFPDAYADYIAPMIAADEAAAAAAAHAAELQASMQADLASRTAMPAPKVAPLQAQLGTGPGLFGSILFGIILLSGAMALMLIVRGETPWHAERAAGSRENVTRD